MTADLSGSHRAAGWPWALPGDCSAPLAPAWGTVRPLPQLASLSFDWWLAWLPPWAGGLPPLAEQPAPAAVLAAVIPMQFTRSDVNLEHLLDTRILE